MTEKVEKWVEPQQNGRKSRLPHQKVGSAPPVKKIKNTLPKSRKSSAPAEQASTVKEMQPSAAFIHKLQMERLRDSHAPISPLDRTDTARFREQTPLAFILKSAPAIPTRTPLPALMTTLPLDKGRIHLKDAFALLGWPLTTELAWTACGDHISLLATQSQGRALDRNGRFLVQVHARNFLRISENDSVLIIANAQPLPSLRSYSLSTVLLALTHAQETEQ